MSKETLKDYLRAVFNVIRGLVAIPFMFVYGLLAIPMDILTIIIEFLTGDVEDEGL